MAELNNTGTGQWSEVDGSNTSVSPDGWPSGTFPNQVEPIGRSTMGAIKRFWDRINGTVTSTGSLNAYIYTPVNVSFPTAYVTGEEYTFKANFANTSASTLNINSLGAKNIFKQGSSGPIALSGGEIQSGQFVKVMYDGTRFQIISALPAASIATISANQVIGTTTNDAATAGYIGEYMESIVSTPTAFPASGSASPGASVALTAGDWELNFLVSAQANGSTCRTVFVNINAVPSVGTSPGINENVGPGPVDSVTDSSYVMPAFRVSLAGSTTYYGNIGSFYTGPTPLYTCRLSARRMR